MPQSEDFAPEHEETVERFDEKIPTQATLRLPERTVEVQIYYVTSDQLTQLQQGSDQSSLHFGLWTCALGVAASLGSSVFTTMDDLTAKHPHLSIMLTSLWWVALFATLLGLIAWRKSKRSMSSLLEQIKKSQR